MLDSDGTWDSWIDLPIHLFTDRNQLVSVAWSEYDDLWITGDLSLPFDLEDATIRWVENSIATVNRALGGTIRSVKLGRAEMSWEGRDVEIWIRLLIELDKGCLEIFNALDENGFAFHDQFPPGEFLPCL